MRNMKEAKYLKNIEELEKKRHSKRINLAHTTAEKNYETKLGEVTLQQGPSDPPLAEAAPLRVPDAPRHTIESVAIASGGGLFVTGWINDTADEIAELRIAGANWIVRLGGEGLARFCRDDVQAALAIPRRHPFGFWGFTANAAVDIGTSDCRLEVVMKSGAIALHEVPLRVLFDQIELRNLALTYLSSSTYMGNPMLDSVASLERSIGKEIVDLNVLISRAIASRPLIERFGTRRPRYKGSIIVCLYGRPEYLTLQAALFSGLKGIEDYEFVYVCNSPELAEQLGRDAAIAARAYGVALTLMLLPGNAGFGAANNAAVSISESRRCLIVNPDVFPFDRDWAAKHTALIEHAPETQTRLFGAPLYYDDGSLMHGGMYFDADGAISMDGANFTRTLTLRVEHYGKGAPPLSGEYLQPRPVPAVTGAFISCDRGWFEKLGGFSEEYVLGHYEDADLCLKSTREGIAPWLQDIRMWHLEGKGSGRRQPAHDGASIVNRWLFNRRWGPTIIPEMLGRQPRHPAFRPQAAVASSAVRAADASAAPGILVPAARPQAAARPTAPSLPERRLKAGQTEIVFGT
jgi:GT2 family glycosyltransferase